jgi:hypothetical protein
MSAGGDEIEPVARFCLDRMHRREPVGHQCRARAEQFSKGLLGAVKQIVGSGLLGLMGHYDPAEIVVRLAFNTELEAGEPCPE